MSRGVGYAYFFCIMMPFVLYLAIFEGMWPILIIYIPIFALSIFLVYRHMQTMKARGEMTLASEFLGYIENLELDDLEYKFRKVLIYTDPSGRTTSKHVGIDEKESLELIDLMLSLLEEENQEIRKLQEDYLTFRPTDSKRFKYAGIVFYSYLLDGRISDFVKTYKEFKDTLISRTEYRVMGRLPGEIKLFEGTISLDFDFLDLMYGYYGQGKDVFSNVMAYEIKNNYHKVLCHIIIEKFARDTENTSVMSDFQEDYDRAVSFRRGYVATTIWEREMDDEEEQEQV